eukprot:UN27557
MDHFIGAILECPSEDINFQVQLEILEDEIRFIEMKMKDSADEVEKLLLENLSINGEIDEMRDKMERMNKKKPVEDPNKAQKKRLQDKIDSLTKENERLGNDLKKKDKQIQFMTQNRPDVSSIENEKKILEEKVKQMESENKEMIEELKKMKEKITDFEKQHIEEDHFEIERKLLQDKIDLISNENKRLKDEVDEQTDELARQKEELELLEKQKREEVELLVLKRTNSIGEQSQLLSQIEELKKRCSDLENIILENSIKENELNNQLDKNKQKLKKYE